VIKFGNSRKIIINADVFTALITKFKLYGNNCSNSASEGIEIALFKSVFKTDESLILFTALIIVIGT
jgi:hypothetical protein